MDFPGFRKTLNTLDLATYLGSEFNLDEEIVARLMDEEIDGLALLQLNESDLRELGIRKMGTLKKILLLIRQNTELGASLSSTATTQVDTFPPVERKPSQEAHISNAVIEVMKRIGNNIQNQVSSSANLTGRSDSTTPQSPSGQISSTTPTQFPIDIKPVIDLTTATDNSRSNTPLSPTQGMQPQTNIENSKIAPPNYEQATHEANRVLSFVSPRTSMLGVSRGVKRPYTLVDAIPQRSTMVARPQEHHLLAKASNLTSSIISKAHRKSTQPQKYINQQNNSKIRQGSPPQISVGGRITRTTTSSTQNQFSPRAAFVQIPHSSKDSVPPKDAETTPTVDTSHPKVVGVKSLSGLNNVSYTLPEGATLQNIDLREEIAKKFAGGEYTVEEIQQDGVTNKQAHRKLMKHSVMILDQIAQSMGHKKYYPPNHVKTEMAKAIIRCFPNLACIDSRRGPQSLYFSASDRSGFIENRYKTLRRSLAQDDKAYKPRGTNNQQYSDLINFVG